MAGGKAGRFDRAIRVAALERIAAGANVSVLGREPGVRRKLLYPWREPGGCGWPRRCLPASGLQTMMPTPCSTAIGTSSHSASRASSV